VAIAAHVQIENLGWHQFSPSHRTFAAERIF
jgi:hypothetical protein